MPGQDDFEKCAAELFEAHLRGFVPPQVFDAHAHLYRLDDLGDEIAPQVARGAATAGWDAYAEAMRSFMGDCAPSAGLFFAYPSRALDIAEANRFVVGEVERSADSRALMMITPRDDADEVAAAVDRHGFAGFKVYHLFADAPAPGSVEPQETFNAPTESFLPDWAWQIADQRGLVIMLHMVLLRSLADERNQRYIREHCLRYPGAKLVLAHAARGFCAHHTVDHIGALRGLDNVFFDTSVVSEPEPMAAILRTFGPTRLMWGSDFPVSNWVGRNVTVGDGFFWLYADNADWSDWPHGSPTLTGIESLLALRDACRSVNLIDRDIERIFCDNARLLLGIDRPGDGSIGQGLYDEAKRRIPGAVQLLSKRQELYAPGKWPAYFDESRGCEVIDADGRRFLDFTTTGIGACLLGYNDPDVTAAVVRRVQLGSKATLNSPAEIDLARLLTDLHPWAEQARFARAGGEAMSIAARIVRAATGRDRIAICGYHGWADWYLAGNLPHPNNPSDDPLGAHLLPNIPVAGVPAALAGTILPFTYNEVDELAAIVKEHGSELAAVIMEPTRTTEPASGFFDSVRELCDGCGARLVIDEITAGFRLHHGGAHLKYGVEPDVAVFAKALGNGHPIAAIIGKAATMDAAQSTFISSTYWTEAVGPTAAVATLRKMQRIDVPNHVERIGRLFQQGCLDLAKHHGLTIAFSPFPALSAMRFDHPEHDALITLMTCRMIERGYLTGPSFYPTLAHEERHVQGFLAAADAVFAELAEAVAAGDVRPRIGGPVRHSTYQRLQ